MHTQKSTELVSVIVPCFNCSRYIRQTVTNILSQTYTNIECIIVDDGSTDNSQKICEELVQMDDRVRYLPKEHGGVAAARNFGIQHAKGKWIQQLDSDDLLHKDKIRLHLEQLSEIDSSRDIIFYTDWDIIWEDDNQQLTQGDTQIVGNKTKEQLLDQLVKWNFLPDSPLSNNTLFVKKNVFRHKIYDETLGSFEDFDLFTSLLLEDIMFVYTPITGMTYRQHSTNMTLDKGSMIENYVKYLGALNRKDDTLLLRCTTIGPLLREMLLNNDKKRFFKLITLIETTKIPNYFFAERVNIKNTFLFKIIFYMRSILPVLTIRKLYRELIKFPRRVRCHLKNRFNK